MRHRSIALLALSLATCWAGPASATQFIERLFSYDARRVHVANREGYSFVDLAGAAREQRAGRPDLPYLAERVELPEGMQVTAVEVLSVESTPIATGARLAPAVVPTPGLGPVERSRPDARYFATTAAQPEELVGLGAQGSMRGRNIAWLRVGASQWNPASGEVRAVTGVRVRLTLEPGGVPAVRRERIVREWEDGSGLGSGVPLRELASVYATAQPGGRGAARPFVAEQLPSVLGSPVAYLIITSDAMAPAFQQLADWKTQSGLPAVVRTVSFIQQQYPSAADDAERIRLFIRDAYARWGTKWVLLGGDTDVIPARLAFTTFYGTEMIASDLYYSCLDGNWNADGDSLYGEGGLSPSSPGDSVDLMPEVYVGRAPVSTPAQAQVFLNKTFQYEQSPLETYEDSWLFFAEVLFPQPWNSGQITQLDGGAIAESLLPLTDLWPQLHIARLYENYTAPTWRAGALPETRRAVIDSLNRGYNLGLHIGHGYRNVMEVGDASLGNSDAMSLTNGNKLFNLYAINCTSNAIDFPCIGEAFLLNPNGGAVTNVGSTRFDFPSTGQSYQYEYFRLFLQDSVTAVGELQARQKLPFLSFSTYDGPHRWTQMTLLMLGDPELRMWIGRPSNLTVTAPASVALSDTQFSVHVAVSGVPLERARVTAYRAGDDYASVLTNASGDAIVPFRPDSIGSLTLVVTAFNCRPYRGGVAIVGTGAPVLSKGAVQVLDGGPVGTVGDLNGAWDAGETVDLVVPMRNRGGSTATGVSVTLATTFPTVTIANPTIAYPDVPAGGQASPVSGFRVSIPYTSPDQNELPFTLLVTDNLGHSYREKLQVTTHAPELRSYSHTEAELVGNGNGRPEPGETVSLVLALRNSGTAVAHGVTLYVYSTDGLSTVTDGISTIGDIAPGATASGDPIQFQLADANAVLWVEASTSQGLLLRQKVDMSYPATPTSLLGTGAATSIALTWAHLTNPDLRGYNVFRSSSQGGPFVKINAVPTDRISYFTDENLTPLTKYYYRVSAVDSSGNESSTSLVAAASTNPPLHAIFPVPMGRNTPSSVALEYIYSSQQMDIVAGSEFLYVLHADGTAPVDADGSGATLGDFTNRGSYYAAGPSVAVLDPAKGWSVIGASWDSAGVYVFDKNGQVRPGWPLATDSPVWSSVAVGDLDGDGKNELCFASNGYNFYVMRSDGSEWMDGDLNPATKGVFKVLGQPYNYGSPALADLDGDGHPEIIYGSRDGNLYAWKADGSNVPGFPFSTGNQITGSVAVGYLDGPGDTQPEIVFAAKNDSLYVLEPNGQRRPGWPSWIRVASTDKSPSVALADMNNDGFLDIVWQSPNGNIYCFNRNATAIPGLFGVRYSALTTGASEDSPVVADINGDGFNDIITGDENGQLNAISGATGLPLPGFPIQLAGEVRGAAAVGDIDRDGMTEIVVADWDKNVYVWDYDFPFQPNGPAPWPQFMHDARRTGFASAPLFVGGVDGGPGGSTAPRALEFAAPAPNPASTATRMWFGIPADLAGQTYELAVYDLHGRRVRLVNSGVAAAGRFSLGWDLRDANGRPVSGGVYFARMTVGARTSTRKLIVLE
jgi:hypothetical protein